MNAWRIILVLLAAALIASFFVPYFKSTDVDREKIEEYGDIKPVESINLTLSEMIDPSLFTYTKVYFQNREELFSNPTEGLIYAILYCLVPFFGLLILIFGLAKKPIPALIFSALTGALGYFIYSDFVSRRIVPSESLENSIGHYLVYGCAVAIFIVSICMMVTKYKKKPVIE